MKRFNHGFTLIELLVVIAIIGIIVGISAFALRGGQRAGRDAKRKSDLEQIRASLELYRSSCNAYPASVSQGGSITGSGTPANCTGTFMQAVPSDPDSGRIYVYTRTSNSDYDLCAALEEAPIPAINMSSFNCGSGCGTASCNYAVSSL